MQRNPLPKGTPGSMLVVPDANSAIAFGGRLSADSVKLFRSRLASPCAPIDADIPVEFGRAVQ
jgi:hypothetical protein